MGYVYFKEPISGKWIIGSLLIVSGVSIIAFNNKKENIEKNKSE